MLRRGVQVAGLPVLISGEHRYIVQAVAVVPEAVIGGQVAVGGDDGVFQTGAFSDELIQELAVELLPQARLVPVVAVVLIKGGLEDIFGGLAEVEIGTARRRRRGGPQHNPVQPRPGEPGGGAARRLAKKPRQCSIGAAGFPRSDPSSAVGRAAGTAWRQAGLLTGGSAAAHGLPGFPVT